MRRGMSERLSNVVFALCMIAAVVLFVLCVWAALLLDGVPLGL